MIALINRRDLRRLGPGALATSWTTPALAMRAGPSHHDCPNRVLHFPENMGWIQPTVDPVLDNLVEACGDVAIPAGIPARLIMLYTNRDAFYLLRELRPDDLDELLCWFKGGSVCLDCIAHLSGVRALEIIDATVEGTLDLNRFPLLEDLTLYGTGISENHISALRRDCPHVHIDYQQST